MIIFCYCCDNTGSTLKRDIEAGVRDWELWAKQNNIFSVDFSSAVLDNDFHSINSKIR